ncbi:MAG TPA: PIN domain-containing protein [Candidatus Sulfomarinibacteraceae bacterium]|nr:PIN domain-containing protein [Candidatus Sulfomarinibacteraceae bacterium]
MSTSSFSSLADALKFAKQVRDQPNAVHIEPGTRHWSILTRICAEVDAKGNLIPDAYLAALAIESGSQRITTDRDYSRFQELDWRHPLKQ